MKINEYENEWLQIFEASAIGHSNATEIGDFKTANTFYDNIVEAVKNLDHHSSRTELRNLLHHECLGVRTWSATFLLQTEAVKEAIQTLNTVGKELGVHGLNARTTLSAWEKGNLHL